MHTRDDEVRQLLAQCQRDTEPDEAEPTLGTPDGPQQDDLLKTIESELAEIEPTGPKINESLAGVAIKRWGVALSTDKLKAILAKHDQPENCGNIVVPR